MLRLTPKQIEQAFVFSQMSVEDEARQSNKYSSINLIEWQDLLCRLCIQGLKHDTELKDRPIQVKVQRFLRRIWDWFFDKELWSRDDRELRFVTLENPPKINVNPEFESSEDEDKTD